MAKKKTKPSSNGKPKTLHIAVYGTSNGFPGSREVCTYTAEGFLSKGPYLGGNCMPLAHDVLIELDKFYQGVELIVLHPGVVQDESQEQRKADKTSKLLGKSVEHTQIIYETPGDNYLIGYAIDLQKESDCRRGFIVSDQKVGVDPNRRRS